MIPGCHWHSQSTTVEIFSYRMVDQLTVQESDLFEWWRSSKKGTPVPQINSVDHYSVNFCSWDFQQHHLTLLISFFCGGSLISLIFSLGLTILGYFMLRSLDVIIKSLKDQIYGRSQSSSKSNLFSFSDDCLAYMGSFFDIDSLVNVDTAVTNVQDRLLWLKFLSTSNTIVAYGSCPSSVRWLLRRGIIVRHIQIRGQ